MALRNVILMALFYWNLYYLTPVILKKRGVATFLVVLVLAVVAVSLVLWQIHHTLSEPFRPQIDRGPMPNLGFGAPRPEPAILAGPAFFSFLITIMVVSISTSMVLWEDWLKARAEEQERAFQRLASELAVLKLQISPHFLFNTLNNIRWLVRSKSENAEEAIIKLSQLLRYILYQTDQDKISLDKEIENLRDYINLQKMRLTDQSKLQHSFDCDNDNKQVVPLLFIPIVENLFKYADFEGAFQNQINLSVTGERLVFKTEKRYDKKCLVPFVPLWDIHHEMNRKKGMQSNKKAHR